MQSRKAFTLIEIIVVCTIAALLVAAGVTSISKRLTIAMRDAEDKSLLQIKTDIITSLDASDYTNRNIFPYADPPASMTPTNFYPNVDTSYVQTSAADWFAKIANVRGTTFTTAAPTMSSQPQLGVILFNKFFRSRLLIPGPTNEANQQRFLLISLMDRSDKLTFPSNDGTANWFNAVWNTDWTNTASQLPAYIAGLMNASQLTAWNGTGSGSNLPSLRVLNITIPKYLITLSNNSSINNGYLYYNGNLNLFTSAASSGPTTTNPIIAGRIYQLYTGTTPATAVFNYQLWLRKNENIPIQ